MNYSDATRRTYDKVADLWKVYRNKPFKEVVDFMSNVKNSYVLDLGCGTGRNLKAINKTNFIVEADYSLGMLKLNPHPVKVLCDARKLPFAERSFDVVLAVSVLHHLPIDGVKRAASEVRRVLKNKGRALLTFWKKEGVEEGKPVNVPWKKEGVSYDRYYYFYSKETIKTIIQDILRIDKIYIDEKDMNYIVEVRK